ncbi:MAG: energy transducer TonB [Saprospiraceae bacterium]
MNITYPYEARINGIEGTVVVSFIVEKDEQLTNIKILRNPGGGLGEDVERIIKAMPQN